MGDLLTMPKKERERKVIFENVRLKRWTLKETS